MQNRLLGIDADLYELWSKLQKLHFKLREHTKASYNRINPFNENLFSWQEKSEFLGYKNSTVYDSATIIGKVELGEHAWVGPFSMLDGSGSLKIGDYCTISTGVHIYTHDTVKWTLSGGKHPYEYAPVAIGDCCFIGAQTVVLKGCSIGRHCLLAANSLVREDIPSFSIVAGNPAQVIGRVDVDADGNVTTHYQS